MLRLASFFSLSIQRTELWELRDKYNDIRTRTEWGFNVAFFVFLGSAAAAGWTLRCACVRACLRVCMCE